MADYASTVTKVNASAISRGISIVGNTKANSLKGGKGADTIFGSAGNDTVSLGGGNDIYVYESGNDLIQDYTVSADKIKLASASITSASLSGTNVVLKTSAGNLTVKGGKNKAITVIDASGKETSQIYPLSTLPAGISISGATLTASTAFTGSKINLADYASTVTKVNASALSRGVSIVGNAKANSLKGSKGADTIFGSAGNDTVSLGGSNDIYVYESGNDLIQDYTVGVDKIKLASASITSASLSGTNVVLKTSSGNLTVKGGKNKAITVIDASGKETSQVYPLSTLPAGISVSGAVLTATAAFTGSKIDLSDYTSTVTKVNTSALSHGISIVGTAAANSLKGGKYSDTISGGTGNDTVSLDGGNDLIQDYTVGADKIKLASASITGASLSGTNVVLKTSSGNITVKNTKGKPITVIDSFGKETTQLYPSYLNYDADKTAVTLASGFTGTLKATDYANSVKKIDASAVTKAIQIIGNDQANTIFGSEKVDTINGGAGNDSMLGAAGNDKLSGDAGADTLIGGSGNDTLTGGTDNDTFVYGGEGKDVITDYTAEADTIKISSGSITKTTYSGNNVIFTVSSGTLTVKNAKGKAISITDASGKTSTKTYTTGVTYGSNGYWFTDDTNFIGETSLDAISAENYAVTNIETARVENLVRNDSLSSALTFYAK